MRSFVPETGFEPARPVIGATTSRWCVYQFRHPGIKTANLGLKCFEKKHLIKRI